MVSCEVTEERNGVYECNFAYPVDGANYEKIQCGRIIGVIHDDTKTIQPFDIVSYTRPINGLVTFHCVHISYRLTGYTMKASNVSNIQEAIVALTQAGTPFNFDYEVMRFGYMSAANGIPLSVRQFIGGVQGSMLDTYGGEILWDKFNVTFTKNRGRLTDFKIRYGLNMINYEEEADFLGTYNQCLPYWTDGTNTIYGDVVSSGFSTYTGRDICMPLDLSDKFETAPAKADLEAKALQYMQNNQTHLPRQNIKVDFVRLQDSGEYEQFENLLQCNLCDSIGVIFPRYGMQGTFKIVRVVYDVLAERYKEMELGALSVSLAEALGIDNSSNSLTTPEELQFEQDGYTPTFTAVSGLTIADKYFKYFRYGRLLYVLGRFQVSAVNTSQNAHVRFTLPDGMNAINMGAGTCGQAVDGVGNDAGFSIRCDGGNNVYIQKNAGGYSVPYLVAGHYYMVNALVFLQ